MDWLFGRLYSRIEVTGVAASVHFMLEGHYWWMIIAGVVTAVVQMAANMAEFDLPKEDRFFWRIRDHVERED